MYKGLSFPVRDIHKLFITLAAGVILVASWVWPSTRCLWDLLDRSVFLLLNQTLESGDTWRCFWAITNMRIFDAISGVVVLGMLVFYIRSEDTCSRTERLVMFMLYILIFLGSKVIWELMLDTIGFSRKSPSLLLTEAIRLPKDIIPFHFKQWSPFSFPSDHGIVLMGLSLFFFFKRNAAYGVSSLALFTPFLLPRMVVGAHWLTDTLVGSMHIALISISVWMFTPLEKIAIKRLLPPAEKLTEKMGLSWLK